MVWYVWAIVIVVILIIILFVIRRLNQGDSHEESFLGRTVGRLGGGCAKIINKITRHDC